MKDTLYDGPDRAIAFELMGLGPYWVERTTLTQAEPSKVLLHNKLVQNELPKTQAHSLTDLAQMVAACKACGLCETRTQTVFGTGVETQVQLMVVGEAPGAEEDRLGSPFVGRAGQLLDNMLLAISQSRKQTVYIANALKCRPPNNRDPLPEELAQCMPFLRQQIELLQPKALMLLGRFAAKAVLNQDAPIKQLRESIHQYTSSQQNIPVVVSYHPAYLLRQPLEKAKAWADLLRVKQLIA